MRHASAGFHCLLGGLLLANAGTMHSARAQDFPTAGPFVGRAVHEVIEVFRARGYPIAYSTRLVPDSLLVTAEPVRADPLGIIADVLRPHGLALKQADGIYLIVRAARGPPAGGAGSLLVIVRDENSALMELPVAVDSRPGLPAVDRLGAGIVHFRRVPSGRYDLEIAVTGYEPSFRTVFLPPGEPVTLQLRLTPALAELEELTVSTSRYVLFSNSQFYIDQRALQNLPGNGDDPIRSAQRLPGAAAGGWSAKSHFRGGEANETAIHLNGLQLLDPFHVRDFHNIFSSIDARTIAGVEAYTGGFPAGLGDRMSGMLLLQSKRPERPRHFEAGISVFNTSLLHSGYSADGDTDWLVSARRSNLGLVLDPDEHGEPGYNDFFASLAIGGSPRTRVSFNALRADDEVLVITEHKAGEEEFATSDTRNQHFWLLLENQWSPRLVSTTVLAASFFENDRAATANAEEQLVAVVHDYREVDMYSIRQDWALEGAGRHALKWGWEASRRQARYRYASDAEYGGFYRSYPGVPETLSRDITLDPRGESYALYLSDRLQLTPATTAEIGLRWDRQSWPRPGGEAQLSPRFNLLHQLDERNDLRLTWGRYHQSQGIHELQVEDGVERFFPAQRAAHLIAGYHRRFPGNFSLRLEAYRKKYSELRPRFENLTDPLPLIPELEPDRIRLAPDSALAKGFEATVEYRGDAGVNWWATYAWSKVTDSLDGHKEPRNWDQRHALQAGLAWARGPWEFGCAANLHSGWPTTAASLTANGSGDSGPGLVFGPRNAERLKDFIRLDLRVAREWKLTRGRLTAFFELSNALGRDNECCVDYDLDDEDEIVLERSVDHWLGMAPALGILWEF